MSLGRPTLPLTALLGLCWLYACAPDAGAPAAAVLGDRTLPAERLATWLVLGQPLSLDPAVARSLARSWVELTALAERSTDWDALLDPELVRAVQWSQIRRRLAEPYLARRISVTEPDVGAVREAYEEGAVRLVAHVLRQVAPESHPEERERQRLEIRRLRTSLIRGMPWPEAVARSEDDETRGRSGLFGLVRRGDLDPALDSVAFRLRPGELSPVVASPRGYHVLYRPRLDDVARILRDLLAEDRRALAARVLVREISDEWEVRLESGWEDRMREVAADPWSVRDAGRSLARHRAGIVPDSVVARYLFGLDPEARAELAHAAPSEIEAVLRDVVSQEVLWLRMRSDGVEVDEEVLGAVTEEYRATLDSLAAALGIRPGTPIDPEEVVASHMEAIVSRRRELVPLPRHLAVVLLRDRDWEISDTGAAAALERAARLLGEATR